MLTVDDHKVLVGQPNQLIISASTDSRLLLESCFETGARDIVLYAENLAPAFFDLSSGMAGDVLQKLRTYGGMRLAVIMSDPQRHASQWFSEMESEERRKGRFGVFATSSDAYAWITQAPDRSP